MPNFANGKIRSMTNKNRKVLNQIKATVRNVVPEGSQVLLFGSRARGEANKDSDWDILIIVDKDRLMQADYNAISYPLVELGWDLNEEINPIMYTKKDWESNSFTPFFHNVQEDGIVL